MKTLPLQSAFRWVGGKWRLFPKLVPLIPDHTTYVSLFGGSAADILRKPCSRIEVYNDLDGDVVNYFRVLQDARKRQQLCVRLMLTPYSRSEFLRALGILHGGSDSPVARAWALYVVTYFGYPSKAPSRTGPGSFTVNPMLLASNKWTKVKFCIEKVAWRLRKVLIECRPWQQVVDRFDAKDTFLYADPPYLWSTRTTKTMYSHEMDSKQHADLLERLGEVKGKVMLSGYPSPLYDELLADWRRVEFELACTMLGKKTRSRRREVVWMNYDEQGQQMQQPLDRESA